MATSLTTVERALEDVQQLKDENDRVKREKCQGERERLDVLAHKKNVEKELHDIRQRNLELVVQINSLQRDIRATEALLHELKTKHTRLKVQKHRLEKEKNDLRKEMDRPVAEKLIIVFRQFLIANESRTTAQQKAVLQLKSARNRWDLNLL